MSSWTSARARLAALSRDHTPDSPIVVEARRELLAARLEDHVRRALTGDPELTAEQWQHIANMLPAAGGEAA